VVGGGGGRRCSEGSTYRLHSWKLQRTEQAKGGGHGTFPTKRKEGRKKSIFLPGTQSVAAGDTNYTGL